MKTAKKTARAVLVKFIKASFWERGRPRPQSVRSTLTTPANGHDNMGISLLRPNEFARCAYADKDVRAPLTRELPHRLKRVDFISILVWPQTNDAGKPQRESAFVPL